MIKVHPRSTSSSISRRLRFLQGGANGSTAWEGDGGVRICSEDAEAACCASPGGILSYQVDQCIVQHTSKLPNTVEALKLDV